MQSLANITITPVANGFVVCLPRVEKSPFEDVLPIFKNMKSEMEKDSLLAALETQNISAANDEEPEQSVKDEHVYVFIRFKDVLSFLSEKYGNQ